MDTWVLYDDRSLATRVSKALDALNVDCPTSQVVDIALLEHFSSQIAASGDLVFLSVRQLAAPHLELLRQLSQSTNASLVVVSAIPDHATVLGAIRAGAEDYLNSNGSLDTELSELTLRIKQKLDDPTTAKHLLAVVPCRSTADGNFLAVNVAAIWAAKYGSCALLDFHLRGGVLAMMLKLTPQHTLLDLIRQRQGIDRSMLEQSLVRHESGIRLLAGPDLFNGLQGLQTQAFQQILDLVCSLERHVIVDVEDLQHVEQVRALAKSNKVVLAMRLEIVSLYSAQKHLEYLAKNGIPREHVHIVTLSTGQGGELPVATVKEVLRVDGVHCIPDDPAATIISLNLGNPLVLESPKSKTAKALVSLAQQLSDDADEPPKQRKTGIPFWKASAILAGPAPAPHQ